MQPFFGLVNSGRGQMGGACRTAEQDGVGNSGVVSMLLITTHADWTCLASASWELPSYTLPLEAEFAGILTCMVYVTKTVQEGAMGDGGAINKDMDVGVPLSAARPRLWDRLAWRTPLGAQLRGRLRRHGWLQARSDGRQRQPGIRRKPGSTPVGMKRNGKFDQRADVTDVEASCLESSALSSVRRRVDLGEAGLRCELRLVIVNAHSLSGAIAGRRWRSFALLLT